MVLIGAALGAGALLLVGFRQEPSVTYMRATFPMIIKDKDGNRHVSDTTELLRLNHRDDSVAALRYEVNKELLFPTQQFKWEPALLPSSALNDPSR